MCPGGTVEYVEDTLVVVADGHPDFRPSFTKSLTPELGDSLECVVHVGRLVHDA